MNIAVPKQTFVLTVLVTTLHPKAVREIQLRSLRIN